MRVVNAINRELFQYLYWKRRRKNTLMGQTLAGRLFELISFYTNFLKKFYNKYGRWLLQYNRHVCCVYVYETRSYWFLNKVYKKVFNENFKKRKSPVSIIGTMWKHFAYPDTCGGYVEFNKKLFYTMRVLCTSTDNYLLCTVQ